MTRETKIMKSKTKKSIRILLYSVAIILTFSLLGSSPGNAQTRKKRVSTASAQRRAATKIPTGTEMKIRLETEIDTKTARDGDKFTAMVETPSAYQGASVEGHVARVKKSGKLTGTTELSLDFDTIRLRSGENIIFDAQVVTVYGEDSKKVDEEGNVKSGSQGKTTAIRSGGGAAAGAVIGAIAGGGKGAAIGAIVGGAAGAGSVLIQGSKKVKLESGTEMLIKTTR